MGIQFVGLSGCSGHRLRVRGYLVRIHRRNGRVEAVLQSYQDPVGAVSASGSDLAPGPGWAHDRLHSLLLSIDDREWKYGH